MKRVGLDPAQTVIRKFGVEKVAELTGKHVSRVYRWMAPKVRGGTDGYIPQSDAEVLLKAAPALGIDLKPADFFASEAA